MYEKRVLRISLKDKINDPERIHNIISESGYNVRANRGLTEITDTDECLLIIDLHGEKSEITKIEAEINMLDGISVQSLVLQ